jgi:gliding motility-associated-like protein
VLNYTLTLSDTTTAVTLLAGPDDKQAAVKINDKVILDPSVPASVYLGKNNNLIKITVTAADGITSQIYTVNINRTSSNVNASAPPVDTLTNGSGNTGKAPDEPKPTNPDQSITKGNGGSDEQHSSGPGSISSPAEGSNVAPGKNNENSGTSSPVLSPPKIEDDKIFVHQALSPNGDGKNDSFQIDGIEKFPDNKVTIIDMNGAKVYEATGYDNTRKFFDGHSSITGAFQRQGTYYYQFQYTANHEIKRKLGYLVIKY